MSNAAAPFRRIGPYLVLQLSGAGGMGRVDVVLSTRPGGFTKVCVLKRILPELRTPEQEARFRREASIALRLAHGAIAQTLDVVEIDGELCLLQEFIHGATLAYLEHRAAGADERLPVALVVHVASEIARALAYAHSFEGGGVIHRDVTPDNIMLSFSGEPKLVDFGIAKSVSDQPLTEVGMVVGRPLYTAPEILAGQDADARSDVYSLGVVLWQALCDQPFPGLATAGHDPASPVPSSINPNVPRELDEITLKAISIEPGGRYQRAEEFQTALVALLPQGYVPDRELASFLERHFNVERERRQLAEDIEKAKLFLEPDLSGTGLMTLEPQSSARNVRSQQRLTSSYRRRLIPLLGAGLLVGVGVAAGLYMAPHIAPRSYVVRRTEPAAHTSALADPRSSSLNTPPASAPPAPVAEPQTTDQTSRTRQAGKSTERPLSVRKSAVLLRDADRSFKSGDLPSALDFARQAAREGGGGEAHLLMGKIFYAQNQLAAAEAEFEKARQSNPAQPEATRYLDLVRKDLARAER